MSKFKGVLQAISNMRKKKEGTPLPSKDLDDLSEEQAHALMASTIAAEEKKPKAYGFNRKLILGIAAVFVLSFVAALFISFSGPEQKKQAMPQDQLADSKGGASDLSNGKLPKKYSELSAYDNPAQKPVGVENGRNPAGVNSAPRSTTVAQNARQEGEYGNSNVPSFNARPYYPQPVLPNYNGMQVAAQPSAPSAAASPKRDFGSNPIRFALSAIESLTGGAKEDAATAGSNPQQRSPKGYTDVGDNALLPGSVIPATLITGINSDLSGQVIAQVSENIYDSATGAYILIPQGSRLVGQYEGNVGTGQERLNVTWSTLLFPNGTSFDIGSMVSIDGAGYAGLKDRVNNHTSKILGTAALTSALASVASIAGGNTSTNYNYNNSNNQSVGQLAASGAASNLLNTATELIRKNASIQPTITIRPGFNFNVFVNVPLLMDPYNG